MTPDGGAPGPTRIASHSPQVFFAYRASIVGNVRSGQSEPPRRSTRRRFLAACVATGAAGIAGCGSANPVTTPGATDGPASETPSTDTPPGTTADATATTAANPCAEPLSTPPEPNGDRSAAGSVAWERSITSMPPADEYLWGPVRWLQPVGEGRLLVATSLRVMALSPASGEVLWESDADEFVHGPSVTADAVVFVADRTPKSDTGGREVVCRALDLEGGDERWTALPSPRGIGPGLELVGASGDLAFVRTADDVVEPRNETLHAVSMTDGSEESIATVSDATATEIADGRLYYGSYHGVTAFDPEGSRAWDWLPGDDGPEAGVRSLSVTCGHAVALAGSYDVGERTLHGFDAGTGERRWTVDGAGIEHLEATGGRLFVGGARIARLDPTSGDPVWTAGGLAGEPIVEYGLVFAEGNSGDGGTVEALAVPDGTTAWSREFDAGVSLLGVTNGRVVVSPESGEAGSRLLGLDPESGETRWETAWTHGADRGSGPSVVGSERAYATEQASEGETAVVRAVTV